MNPILCVVNDAIRCRNTDTVFVDIISNDFSKIYTLFKTR